MPGPLDYLKNVPNLFHGPWDDPIIPEESVDKLADAIDSPTLERGPWEARLRGFGAGALQGLRNQLTPANLAALALPMLRGGKAISGAVKGLSEAIPAAKGIYAAEAMNPAVMEQMYQRANPVFKAMSEAGQFAGDRSTFSTASKVLPRAAETLGETNPEFTAVGGEGLYNIAKAGLKKVVDPAEQAYHNILARRGRDVASALK